MKNKILLIGILLVLGSCTDEKVGLGQSGIIGSWEWLSSSGGFAGTTTAETVGYSVTIIFNEEGNYYRYVADTLHGVSTYEIVMRNSIFSSDSSALIQYEDRGIRQFVSPSVDEVMDTLRLWDECYDCSYHTYIRK